jgi:type IV pilus assembly protein PilB
VLRLLSGSNQGFTLANVGMTSPQIKAITEAIQNPHGMVLVVGPTGSGKTTTVYAMLKVLNSKEVHVSSIEDPVEYDIPGVSQIQVDPKTNLTFVSGLRAIVRQDPDIIFVGEIRDKETAGISINAALTGHLVLSTLHANDAVTTLHRFLDMGVEPFLVVTTVRIVIAQRLVRKICTACRASYQLSKNSPEGKMLKQRAIENDPYVKRVIKERGYTDIEQLYLFRGAGCAVCGHTGYKERIGIFEVLEVADRIKDLIMRRGSHDEMERAAKEEGMTTMFENGLEMVVNGVTTFEEVFRVIYE